MKNHEWMTYNINEFFKYEFVQSLYIIQNGPASYYLMNYNFFWMNRHGIRQLRSGWADGPAYVTQCPIQTGQSYVYNFTVKGQRGTLFWHAHISWLRATLYGPIVILPKRGVPYPFPHPFKEVPIIFGKYQLFLAWNFI